MLLWYSHEYHRCRCHWYDVDVSYTHQVILTPLKELYIDCRRNRLKVKQMLLKLCYGYVNENGLPHWMIGDLLHCICTFITCKHVPNLLNLFHILFLFPFQCCSYFNFSLHHGPADTTIHAWLLKMYLKAIQPCDSSNIANWCMHLLIIWYW